MRKIIKKNISRLIEKLNFKLNQTVDNDLVDILEIGCEIPKIIHQVYPSSINLPKEIQENITKLKKMNPDWVYKFYDDDDMYNYIKLNYPNLLKIYNKINPIYGAGRADFFRYLVIYKEGGIYLDIKSSVTKPLNEIILPHDKFLLSYWQNSVGEQYEKWGIYSDIKNDFGEFQQWHITSVKGTHF